ncbi:phosphoribosylamine--glycine ligase [Desulfohalobiaceae bacterium Ax17]|uniref:phosphoribosylamine--glycine ligase n=1 Tax=Desulfovulcanus ferrireducens TaxID=2831190 RepID=UPI00207BC07F|nr:phosphoribosylamine--glycine ligase [Desulfovulcanus ferrireducens]MBT8762978.1 phosphoribosylamine--glycine ligase [Desulfovulcanus ferrireducens]
MNILVVGSGGREHALAWKIKQSPLVKKLYIAPGNGGTAQEGENVPISADDIPELVKFAQDKKIDLVVAGPELPLVLGLKNSLDKAGIPCFGPGAFAAQLEGSKAFAKSLMAEAEVPTADFKAFDDYIMAKEYLATQKPPIVIKADGLAAGKGVIIAETMEEAQKALEDMMVQKIFGAAGERVVIEEALTGEEASFLAFCDGHNIAFLPSSQDHKRIGENDTGPNTGGMGAYSPAPILPEDKFEETADLVIKPVIQHLEEMGHPFKGVLYAGLMITDSGPKVLEYNVRFGDPECQPLLMRLENDLVEVMLACVEGTLNKIPLKINPKHSMCVVLAAKGYPGSYAKGHEISGIEEADNLPGVKVFHAGTSLKNGQVITNGGRVLGVTALGDDLKQAKENAYAAVSKISFQDMYFRRDIGDKGLRYNE